MPKLLERVREVNRTRHYTLRTEHAYVRLSEVRFELASWLRRTLDQQIFAWQGLFPRSPDLVGVMTVDQEVLTYIAVELLDPVREGCV